MSNPNGQSPNQANAAEEVGSAGSIEDAGEKILRNMLEESKLFAGPGAMSGGWCMVELDRDGKKVPNAVLLLAQNNTVTATWYDADSMEEFARSTMVTLHMLQQAKMASMPLIVANQGQMQQAVQAKEAMDGKFGSKQDINWPPESWKK